MNLLITARLLVAAQELVLPWALLERAEAALRDAALTLPLIGGTTAFKNGRPDQMSVVRVAEEHAKPLLALADEIAGCFPRLPAPTPAWMRPRSQSLGYPARSMPTSSFFSRGKEQAHA